MVSLSGDWSDSKLTRRIYRFAGAECKKRRSVRQFRATPHFWRPGEPRIYNNSVGMRPGNILEKQQCSSAGFTPY